MQERTPGRLEKPKMVKTFSGREVVSQGFWEDEAFQERLREFHEREQAKTNASR